MRNNHFEKITSGLKTVTSTIDTIEPYADKLEGLGYPIDRIDPNIGRGTISVWFEVKLPEGQSLLEAITLHRKALNKVFGKEIEPEGHYDIPKSGYRGVRHNVTFGGHAVKLICLFYPHKDTCELVETGNMTYETQEVQVPERKWVCN